MINKKAFKFILIILMKISGKSLTNTLLRAKMFPMVNILNLI